MENKYYTPTIDEFHVGFRFEVLNNAIWEWQHMNASRLQEINFDDNIDNMSKYRVKYLDKTDIESLGFEQSKFIDGNISETYINANLKTTDDGTEIYLGYNLDTKQTIIRKYTPEFSTYTNRMEYMYKPLFDGRIKNKSELVKLLKMLGIC